jgi:hypothetical protein
VEKAKREHQSSTSARVRDEAMREMADDERATMIEGLKRQWEEVYQEYQRLSVIIDTIPKRQYKQRLENQMKLLEKDIDLLAKHHIIYIAH